MNHHLVCKHLVNYGLIPFKVFSNLESGSIDFDRLTVVHILEEVDVEVIIAQW